MARIKGGREAQPKIRVSPRLQSSTQEKDHDVVLASIPLDQLGKTRQQTRTAAKGTQTGTGSSRLESQATFPKKRKLRGAELAKDAHVSPAKRSSSRSHRARNVGHDTRVSEDQPTPFIPNWLVPAMRSFWQTIFHEAASDNGVLNTKWLLETALVCREFAEPAINALFYSPPLSSEKQARSFLSLVKPDRIQPSFDYGRKVRVLRIPYETITQDTTQNIIRCLPRLQHLAFDHILDKPPYRDLSTPLRRSYHPFLWVALHDQSETSGFLHSWKWSSRLMGTMNQTDVLRLHRDGPLRHLKNVHLVNFHVPSAWSAAPPDSVALSLDETTAGKAAACISSLKRLEGLVLEASTIVDDHFLSLLPPQLKRLEIINCWHLTSENLCAFLSDGGGNMRSLILNQNESLDLVFLTKLGSSCPLLEHLEVDMSLYKDQYSLDSEPSYDEVLLADQVPSWPSSIQRIELSHIRRWSQEAVEMFLQSLIDSAPDLPRLRHLSIKASLDISWRQRALFRLQWLEKMQRVFLRECPPPEIHHSLRQVTLAPGHRGPEQPLALTPRRSARKAAQQSDDPSSRASSVSRRLSHREPGSDMEMEESNAGGKSSGASGPFIHGLCNTVDITLENQKPSEFQFSMDDFVDEEQPETDDSDYDGDMSSSPVRRRRRRNAYLASLLDA